MKGKKLVSLLLALILMLSMAACGGSGQGEGEGTSDGILIWNIGTEPKYIDPQLNTSADGGHVDNNLFEGLMVDTRDGLEYGVAESYDLEANADGVADTVYTFHLREDAKWSDGEPVVAGDFVYAWIRACKPETTASSANLIFDYVKGAKEFYNGEGALEDVKIEALDDHTLRVELNNPVPYFLALTSFYTYMPVREDVVEGQVGWDKDPATCISNGPFKLAEYKIGSHILMLKNEHYWDAENVKLEGVKGLMIQEATTAMQGYEAGDIQVNALIPQEDVPKLLAEDPNFYSEPSMSSAFYSFNVDVEPTNDVNVRKALTLAIDRKQLVEQVLRGGELPASAYVPPAFSLSDGATSFRELDADGKTVKEYGIDPWGAQVEEAQAYLAAAGYPNGEGFPEIELLYNQDENDKKIAEAIQNMWKENLGITVNLRSEEWGTFISSRYNGNHVICRGNWGGDYNDPMTMLDLFSSYGINYSQWRWAPFADRETDTVMNPANKTYDELLAKAAKTTGEERDKTLKAAEKILVEDEAVILPLYFPTDKYVIDSSRVTGVERAPMGHWIFKNAELID